MNTLYLHIGTQKTATTTIQHFLVENDEVLKTKGYTYPLFPDIYYPYWDNTRNGLFIGHPYYNKNNERDYEKEEQYFRHGMKAGHELFKTYPNVILSEERLWLELFFDKARIMKRLIEDSKENGYQIKLILYLRRQDKFIESYWNQEIKSTINETDDLDQFVIDFKHLNYYYPLKVITDVLGEENLIAVRFSDAVKGEGIISDFMHRIGLELTEEYNITQESTNSRLSGNALEIKRIINQMDELLIGDQIYLKDRMRMMSEISDRKYRSSALSEEERTAFMEKFKKGNALLVEHYIGDGKPLFSDDYSGLPKWEKDNPEFLDDMIMTSAAGDVLLYRRIKEADRHMEKIEKRIDKLEAMLEKLKDRQEKQSVRIDHLRHPLKAVIDITKK